MVVKDKLRLIPWKELSKYANDKIVSKTEVGDMSILLFIKQQALRNSCELLRQRKELHTSS